MNKKKILVTGVAGFLGSHLADHLIDKGFEVLAAYDGETALHILRREKPDLVILDVMLPLKDGFSLAQDIRKHKQKKHLI